LKFKRTLLEKITGRARLSLCLALTISPLLTSAASKISVTPYLDYNYSTNIFWDYSAVKDSVFSPGLNLNLAASQFNFFLSSDNNIYQSNDYLNQSMIFGGLNYSKILSTRTSLFLSADLGLTQFKDDMSYLNTVIPSLAIGLKQVLSAHVYSRIGLNLRHSDYTGEASFDRWRMTAFLELSAFLKTQTTLRLTCGLNYLYFPHVAMEVPLAVSASMKIKPETIASSTAGAGHRRHTPDPPGQDIPSPSPPSPDPSDPQPESQITFVSTTIDLSIPQPFVMFRVSQGLGYKTGLIAEIHYRKNRDLVQRFDPLAVDEWALQQMDEDFFWQGTRFSFALKTEAILKLQIAVDFSYFLKQYDGLDALDMNGDPIVPQAFRTDRLTQVIMKIEKSSGQLSCYLAGGYRKNISNDLYFQYGSYTISMGLDYGF
jgi:hypothetical protein